MSSISQGDCNTHAGEIGDNGCAKLWAVNKVYYGKGEIANIIIY